MERQRMGRPELASVQWLEYLPFRKAFAELLDPELYTLEWLDHQILTNEFRLFTFENSAILASIRTFPTGAKEVHVEAAVGELNVLTTSLIALVEEWAKWIGCIASRIESREGWSRIMKSSGYLPYQTAIRKGLS